MYIIVHLVQLMKTNLWIYLLERCQRKREGSAATIVCNSVNICLLMAFVVTSDAATSRGPSLVKKLVSGRHDLHP